MAKQTIAIIDYGMGNIRSVAQALSHVAPNAHILVTNDKTQITQADKIVFPGQGAMGACMDALVENDLVKVIKQNAKQKPFLGICLGLQLLFEHSDENNGTKGLGILAGNVKKFADNSLKIPHMGWNTVKQEKNNPLWHNIDNNAYFYSVHSYFVQPNHSDSIIGSSDYGIDFACAIAENSLFAVQFHPEKSQNNGLQLLTNFINLT